MLLEAKNLSVAYGRAKLLEINRAGTSILLVEQNARMALDVCHRAYVFETGRIALTGTRADLLVNAK